MTHRQAVLTMLVVALLWSIAGVVTRQLEAAQGFETNFWRSLFNLVALLGLLGLRSGPRGLWRALRSGERVLWISSLCWCVMFTNFMLALSMTPVANVLITMSTAPLLTALTARAALGHRLAVRTWVAIGAAGVGIVWMFAAEVGAGSLRQLAGMAVALGVPVAAAINWTVIQHTSRAAGDGPEPPVDLLPALPIGAALAVLLSLPLSLPFAATGADLAWLGLLGVVQLAIPCLLAVTAARSLSAPEVSLLALTEVVFGVAWAWLGANERPSGAVLGGGALVLAALVTNEWLAMRGRRAVPPAAGATGPR